MDPRRAALLDAMGIQRYVLRGGPADLLAEAVESEVVAHEPVPAVVADVKIATQAPPAPVIARATRPTPVATKPTVVDTVSAPVMPAPDTSGLDWSGLRAAVEACRRCGLCETRTQTVFGVGDISARWLIVGEAPGADEDRAGEPFVGRAGQLLNAMLNAAGQPRASVYIANVLKCRPPANRDPSVEEVRHCLPNLQRQIDLVAPDLIVCVGRVAAQNLLGVDTPLAQLRGKVHRLGSRQTPVIVTYHPAYLLRSPGEKRKAWMDLKFALEVADGHRT